jgi:serine/threonine protein kinase
MGKQLDGRSDVYALGVVAYELITGRLPFPDAKGPAGLITAQLKQTPMPPSQANPKANLTPQADRTILKCLEKDKNNRYADVTALAVALQEVLDAAREQSNPLATPLPASAVAAAVSQPRIPATPGADMLETRKGEMPQLAPPPAMPGAQQASLHGPGPALGGARIATPGHGTPITNNAPTGYPQAQSNHAVDRVGPMPGYQAGQPQAQEMRPTAPSGNSKLIWWIVGLLVLGAGAGAVAAYFMQ